MTESKGLDILERLDFQNYMEPTRPIFRDAKAEIQRLRGLLTHPEAQGNKDLDEPAASGLEVTEEMVLRGAIKLASDENHPTLFTQGFDEDGVCAAVRQIYLRRSRTILQAALAAAPTSPQPINGESDAEKAERDLRLFGTAAMRDGEHVPVEEIYLTAEEIELASNGRGFR